MYCLIISRTRNDLSPEEMAELGRLAQGFYDHLPRGVRLCSDWAALDRSRTFAFLEVDSEDLLERVQAPFMPYVDMEVVPVAPVSGWGQGAS